jgi:hypothetical protein
MEADEYCQGQGFPIVSLGGRSRRMQCSRRMATTAAQKSMREQVEQVEWGLGCSELPVSRDHYLKEFEPPVVEGGRSKYFSAQQ